MGNLKRVVKKPLAKGDKEEDYEEKQMEIHNDTPQSDKRPKGS